MISLLFHKNSFMYKKKGCENIAAITFTIPTHSRDHTLFTKTNAFITEPMLIIILYKIPRNMSRYFRFLLFLAYVSLLNAH